MQRETMASLCDSLTNQVSRPVVDETGLKGEYGAGLLCASLQPFWSLEPRAPCAEADFPSYPRFAAQFPLNVQPWRTLTYVGGPIARIAI